MMNESAVMPMATMAPAMPGRFNANPIDCPSSTINWYVMVAASTSDTPYVCAEVNLDCCLVHYDDNFKKLRAMKDKYQRHVTITDPGRLGCLMLTSWHEEKSVINMIREFEIETRDEYLKRSLAQQEIGREP